MWTNWCLIHRGLALVSCCFEPMWLWLMFVVVRTGCVRDAATRREWWSARSPSPQPTESPTQPSPSPKPGHHRIPIELGLWSCIWSNKCNQCDFESSLAGNLRRQVKRHSGDKSTNPQSTESKPKTWHHHIPIELGLWSLLTPCIMRQTNASNVTLHPLREAI